MKYILFVSILVAARLGFAEVSMLVIGDSTVTGAATDTNIKARFSRLLSRIGNVAFHPVDPRSPVRIATYPFAQEFNITSPIARMPRITFSVPEKISAYADGGLGEFKDLILSGQGSLAFDVPEYSFAYMVGRGLHIPANQMLMVAQDGQRVSSISDQIARARTWFLPRNFSTFPSLVLIWYGLNDICHPDEISHDISEFKARFQATVDAQIESLLQAGHAEGGTTIVISAPLDVIQLLTNKNLLSQRVAFAGADTSDGRLTCGEVFDQSGPHFGPPPSAWHPLKKKDYFLKIKMREALVNECRGIRETSADPAKKLEKIRELQQAQIDIWQNAIDHAQVRDPNLKWIFAKSVRDVQFSRGDLANDCFHPSVRAHTKIARGLLANELHGFQIPDRATPVR